MKRFRVLVAVELFAEDAEEASEAVDRALDGGGFQEDIADGLESEDVQDAQLVSVTPISPEAT